MKNRKSQKNFSSDVCLSSGDQKFPELFLLARHIDMISAPCWHDFYLYFLEPVKLFNNLKLIVMKYLLITFAFVFAAFSQTYAQDPEREQAQDSLQVAQDSTQVTDEELQKYAVAMDSINGMKASLLKEINTIVKEDGKMTNARYNELSKIANDEAKLAQSKATKAERALLIKVAETKANGTEQINTTFQTLAKDYVGAESDNKIKKALTTDQELRAKYEGMLKELEKG